MKNIHTSFFTRRYAKGRNELFQGLRASRHGRHFCNKSAFNEGARYQNDICCRSIVPESPCDQSPLPFRVPQTSIHPCHTAAILSRETKRALFYHAKPRNGNHGDEAQRGRTNLFWSPGAIWPPCDKGELFGSVISPQIVDICESSGFDSRSGLNFSGLSFAAAQVAQT